MPTSVTREFVFAHYTSYDLRSRDPSEDTWIPVAPTENGSPRSIPRKKLELVRDRFVYLFCDGEAFRQVNPFLGQAVADGTGNPLVAMVRINNDGSCLLSEGVEVLTAARNDRSPVMRSLGKSLALPLEVEGTKIPVYILVSRTLLPAPTIEKLQARRPAQIPLVDLFSDTHFAVVTDGATTPSNPEWALFVVDPISITESLTKSYYQRCDEYLAITQPYAGLTHEADAAVKKRQDTAEVRRLKRLVAESLDGIIAKSASAAAQVDTEALAEFKRQFDAELKRAVERRETAAHNLIHWLRSDLWRDIDESYRSGASDGALKPDYDRFLSPLCAALARLPESDPGVSYLFDLIEAQERDSGADLNVSNVFALNEFILRGQGALHDSAQVSTVAITTGANFVAAWGGVVTAVWARNLDTLRRLGVQGALGSIKAPRDVPSPLDKSVLGRSAFRMASALRNVYGVRKCVEIFSPAVAFVVRSSSGPKRPATVVQVLDVSYGIPDDGGASLKAKVGALTQAKLVQVLGVLNVMAAAFAAYEAFNGVSTLRTKAFTIVDLAQNALALGAATPKFVSYCQRLNGRTDLLGRPLVASNAVVSAAGLLGSVFSLVSASNRALIDYETKDYDAFSGNAGQGIGAILSGIGAALILKGGATGPAAGYFLLAGSVVTLTSYAYTAFADDSDVDVLAKFSAFGKQAGADAPAPKWALCVKDNFKEWSPNTLTGLNLQLDAFRSIFFAFIISRVDGKPDTLRIFPSALRADSRFEIVFTAHYMTDLPRDVSEGDVRRAGHQRTSRVRVDASEITMEMVDGAAIRLDQVTFNQNESSPAIDIRVDPDPSASDRDEQIAFPKLDRLSCTVTLDVYGDRKSLFVPRNKSGKAEVVKLVVSDARKNVPGLRGPGTALSTGFHS